MSRLRFAAILACGALALYVFIAGVADVPRWDSEGRVVREAATCVWHPRAALGVGALACLVWLVAVGAACGCYGCQKRDGHIEKLERTLRDIKP